MNIEAATGSTTVEQADGSKEQVEYNLDLHLPESVKEYETAVSEGAEPFEGLLKDGEKASAQTLRAILDYERRRQRAKARPDSTKGTGIQKVQRAMSKAIKEGTVDKDAVFAAMRDLGIPIE